MPRKQGLEVRGGRASPNDGQEDLSLGRDESAELQGFDLGGR